MQNPYGQFGYPTFTAPFYQQQPFAQQPMFQQQQQQQQQLSPWPHGSCPGQQNMPQNQHAYRKCRGAAGGKSASRPASSRHKQKQRERRARRAAAVTRPTMRRESSKKNLEELNEAAAAPCLSPWRSPPPAPHNTLEFILAERAFMAQFDSTPPPMSTMALAMSMSETCGNNLGFKQRHEASDEDQDWSDFDADATPAQTTQAMEAKIQNQAALILDLESRNSNLSERVTELDNELSEVKRQNQQIAESASSLAARHTNQQCMANDDECTDETGQSMEVAWSERVTSQFNQPLSQLPTSPPQ